MSNDDLILEEMNRQSENPRNRREIQPTYAQSEFTAEELRERFGDKVWVKCVSEREPWANEQKLKLWRDYLIPVEEAILLDERRFAVILIARFELVDEEEEETPPPAPKAKPTKRK